MNQLMGEKAFLVDKAEREQGWHGWRARRREVGGGRSAAGGGEHISAVVKGAGSASH